MEKNSLLVAPSRRRACEIAALNECVASGQLSAQQIEAHRIAGDFEPFFAQPERPAYPSSQVSGPCVCGSWPGGECLKCEWTPAIAQPEQIAPVRQPLTGSEIADISRKLGWGSFEFARAIEAAHGITRAKP